MTKLSDAFVSDVAMLSSPLGALQLGVVDADAPGIAEGVSRLLVRSIQDARETNDGHLPNWLVDDIERNYISPAKIRTLWARTGHRFAVIRQMPSAEELIATVHVARAHGTILTIDRHRINVLASEHPGFKPEGYHHVVNLSVKHELRRAAVGTLMVDGIVKSFRSLFNGDGLWVRADPPWHAGLVGLGFEHDPSMDVFLPESAERTSGLPHAMFNRLHGCDCAPAEARRPAELAERRRAMETKKLQYVSFTRAFGPKKVTIPAPSDAPLLSSDPETLDAYATAWSGHARVLPRAVARPGTVGDVAALLAWASREKRSITLRGAGFSSAGQCASDDIVLSTGQLGRILSIGPDRIRVEGGTTWQTLLEASAPGHRYPPVIPGWLPATVGGTLSTGGFSKGSRASGFVIDHVASLLVVTGDGRKIECSRTQAGWLFDAVLGGYGRFGVIVEATLRLTARRPFVRVTKTSVSGSLAAAVSAEPDAFHVTLLHTPSGWMVVRAYEQDGPAAASFASFVERRSTDDSAGPRRILQFMVPLDALDRFVAGLPRRRPDDTIQIHPVRQLRPRTHGLLLPEVEGDVACIVTMTSADASAPERPPFDDLSRECGAVPTLLGISTLDERPAWLDARAEIVRRVKSMADPRKVLGSSCWPLDAQH